MSLLIRVAILFLFYTGVRTYKEQMRVIGFEFTAFLSNAGVMESTYLKL